jgi:nucleoside-diphosphate-sugar epimerase
MKRILVTGAAGYIGSLLVTELVARKYDVTAIDNLSFSKTSLLHLMEKKNFNLIVGDVTNKKLIKKEIKNKDIIIPLAALVGAPLCDKFKKQTVKINLESIKFLLSKLKSKQKIIYMNSNSGYGVGKKNKFCDENTPLNPISLYGRTKAQAEIEVMKFKNSICFRLATVFGYSYRMRTDVLVNNFVLRAITEKKLELFEPNFRRNYIHVRDVVRAILFSIDNFSRMKSNIYNLGLSTANLTKKQLALKIKKRIKDLKISIKEGRDPDKRDYFVSNKKIEKFGFRPIHQIDEGIDEMTKVFKIKTKFNNNY